MIDIEMHFVECKIGGLGLGEFGILGADRESVLCCNLVNSR